MSGQQCKAVPIVDYILIGILSWKILDVAFNYDYDFSCTS